MMFYPRVYRMYWAMEFFVVYHAIFVFKKKSISLYYYVYISI